MKYDILLPTLPEYTSEYNSSFLATDTSTTDTGQVPEREETIQPGVNRFRDAIEAGQNIGDASALIDLLVNGYNEVQDAYTSNFANSGPSDAKRKEVAGDYILKRREHIVKQTVIAISTNSLPTVGNVGSLYTPEAIEEIAEAYVDSRFDIASERQMKAKQKADVFASAVLPRTVELNNQPAHITIKQESENSESKKSFRDVLKGFGSAAFSRFQTAPSIISGSIDISPRVQEAMPGQPAKAKDLTGDSLTVTIKTVRQ